MLPPAYDVEFLSEHAGYVRALARQLVFDEQLAQDIEQQTWLTALEHAPRDPRSPRAWLAQLVRNFASRAWRGQARRVQREHAVARPEGSVTTPEEVLERESVRRALVEAVLALDEPYRTALILRFIDGLAPRAIALRLNAPLATVRTRIQRGLELLRASLRRKHGDEYGAWSVGLVHLLRLEPVSYRIVATAAAKTLIQGALLMSVVQKVVLGGAALVAIVAALWVWGESRAATPLDAVALHATTDETAQLPSGPVSKPLDDQRVEANSRPEATTSATAKTKTDTRFGSLLLHVVWAEDGTPAAVVSMRLYQAQADDYYHDTLDVCTGDDGAVLVERILAGAVDVRFDRGGRGSVQVEPGARSEATLTVPAGVDVSGIVLDIDGRPFAGADIYLAVRGASYEGFVVDHSAADGSFEVRALAPRSFGYISARASDRAPTKQVWLLGSGGTPAPVRLQFESAGGALDGRVSSANGDGIANADVLVGSDGATEHINLPDGSLGDAPAAQRVRSSARGEFQITGVAPGRREVHVRADGFAPWNGEVEVFERRASALDVRLTRGARLTGIVRSASGEPVGDAEVWANATVGFASTMRKTASDGAFAMSNLPLGEFEVTVDHERFGHADAQLFGVEGGELRWDPVLSHGLVLRGHIVAPGRDLFGWSVIAFDVVPATPDSWVDRVKTDQRGHFEISGCPSGPLRVRLYAPDAASFPAATFDNIRAGDDEVTLTADPSFEPSVYLRGRIVDVDGSPLAGAAFCPCFARFETQPLLNADAVTGRFEIGPYPAGEWWIRAISRTGATSTSPKHTLLTGETWDFGDLQVVRGAVVVVNVRCACGAPDTTTIAKLRDDTGWNQALSFDGNEGRSPLVAPGHYVLTIERAGCAKLEREIVVSDGDQQRIDVELRAP